MQASTDVMATPAAIAVWVVLIVLGPLVARGLVRFVQRARLAKSLGCAAPQNIAPIKDPILGLDTLWATLRAAKDGRYLPFINDKFKQVGNTFVTKRALYDTIHTIDPENLKHMLSTDFHSFRLSDVRVKAMGPLFGNGIFTTEGRTTIPTP